MGLALVIETINRVMDGRVESAGIGEGAVGELMLLEVSPMRELKSESRNFSSDESSIPEAVGEMTP
jgi:hypothetical protein